MHVLIRSPFFFLRVGKLESCTQSASSRLEGKQQAQAAHRKVFPIIARGAQWHCSVFGGILKREQLFKNIRPVNFLSGNRKKMAVDKTSAEISAQFLGSISTSGRPVLEHGFPFSLFRRRKCR
jgi:hypothetical protein